MKKDFISFYEDIFKLNKDGNIRNLMITGEDDFLEEALYGLNSWIEKKKFNLVKIDEDSDKWFDAVGSRELFGRLSEPNTVLLVKNYATLNWCASEEYNPHNFLRDAALNRHYGCGNDWFPPDDLPNLLFVVAATPICKMYWDDRERETFFVLQDQVEN